MKFAVTAITISRMTRRRMGKSRVELVDTDSQILFQKTKDPLVVEQVFEKFYNELHPRSHGLVKVIDVREV